MVKDRVVEIFAGLSLIVFLILLVLFVFAFTGQNQTISNSYNINTYNTQPKTQKVYTTPINTYKVYERHTIPSTHSYRPYFISDGRTYITDAKYTKSTEHSLRYIDKSYYEKFESVFGTPIEKYIIHVKNREYKGGYFTVKFYFKDYYGKTESETMTKYIPARQEKIFLLKDINSKHEYQTWYYEVISRTKTPAKIYSTGNNYINFNKPGTPTHTYFYLN